MTLTLRVLGLELIHLEVSTDNEGDEGSECDEPGSCTTYPVGFVGSGGDQAWEAGVER